MDKNNIKESLEEDKTEKTAVGIRYTSGRSMVFSCAYL